MVDEKELKSQRYHGKDLYFHLDSGSDKRTYLSEREIDLGGMRIVDNPFYPFSSATEEDNRQEGLLLKLEQAKKKH